MPSQHAIEIFALINYAIFGFSLLLQPRAWAAWTAWLIREGEAGALVYGFVCMLFGSLIVAFHPVWHGVLVILTLCGWIQVIKGVIFLLAPGCGLRLMTLGGENRAGLYRLGGLISLAVAVVIFAALLMGRF